MIKLIKRGNVPEERLLRVNCPRCRSLFEFRPKDAGVKFNSDQRDGDFYSFDCTECGHLVTQNCRTPNFYEDH